MKGQLCLAPYVQHAEVTGTAWLWPCYWHSARHGILGRWHDLARVTDYSWIMCQPGHSSPIQHLQMSMNTGWSYLLHSLSLVEWIQTIFPSHCKFGYVNSLRKEVSFEFWYLFPWCLFCFTVWRQTALAEDPLSCFSLKILKVFKEFVWPDWILNVGNLMACMSFSASFHRCVITLACCRNALPGRINQKLF